MRQPNYALYCIKMSIPTIIAHPSNLLYSASNFEIEQQIFTTKTFIFYPLFPWNAKKHVRSDQNEDGNFFGFFVSLVRYILQCLKKGHHSTSISLCKVLLSVEEGDDTHLFGTMPLSPSSLESLSILPRISA